MFCYFLSCLCACTCLNVVCIFSEWSCIKCYVFVISASALLIIFASSSSLYTIFFTNLSISMSPKLGHGNEQRVDPLRDYFYISLLEKKECFNSPILPILAFFLASFFFDLSPFLCVSCYWSYNCSFLFCVIAPDFFFTLLDTRTHNTGFRIEELWN